MYLVPAKVIPDERQVVRYVEGSILVEERELAAAPGPAREPDHHGVVLVPPRLEEEVEHPAQRDPARASDMVGVRIAKARHERGSRETGTGGAHLASWVLGRR